MVEPEGNADAKSERHAAAFVSDIDEAKKALGSVRGDG
jgi:hypothetical protein